MEKTALRKVKELQSQAKQVLEQLLQQRLGEEDRVAIVLLPAAAGSAEDAWDRLERRLDEMAARAQNTPDEEIEAGIDEAMAVVRSRKR